ncbi:hypothetical protein [Stenoxybacter acetivorans]|uniref:hypothetical protein n=1 Tax=Stenoxybacter acetivorans TaxID=422441 RepID=UPI00056157A4|nr:hypothetical protein [Stenoxybacter acetivorans]
MSNYYDKNVGRDLVTVDEILSMYLWDSKTPPSGSDLKDDKWIRDSNALGKPLQINAQEYMDYGAGRFASSVNALILINK